MWRFQNGRMGRNSERMCGEKFRRKVCPERNGEGNCGETCRGEVYGGIQMGSVGRNGNGKCVERDGD